MRWKWIAGTGLFLILALMAAAYAFLYTFDYNRLKPQIARRVEEATGRQLDIGGRIDLVIGLSPALVVTDITFGNAPWGTQPYMLRLDKLQAQLRLLPLLIRVIDLKTITCTGVDILLETNPDGQGNWKFPSGEGSTKSPCSFKANTITAINIRFKNGVLTFRDGKTGSANRLKLFDFKVAEQTAGHMMDLDIKGDYNGQPLTLSGKTGLVHALLASERFPYELSGAFSDAAIKFEGAIDDVLKLKGIDSKVQISGKNLAELRIAKNIHLPKTSAFELTGHVAGSKASLALNDLRGTLSEGDLDLVFSGTVGDLTALRNIDLQFRGSGKSLTELDPILDQKLPATDEFALQGRLTGSARALHLQAAQGSARRGGLDIALSGEVGDLIGLSGLDLKLKGSGKDLAEFGSFIGEKLPATDEFALQGRLTGSAKALSLNTVQGNARRGNLELSLQGKIKDLKKLSGMELNLKGSGMDLAEIGPINGRKLPATDKFELQGRLMGSTKALSLQNIMGRADRNGMSIAIDGEIMDVLALGNMNFRLKAYGKELAAIGPLVGSTLSKIGPFDVRGHLSGSAKLLLFDNLSVILGKSDFNGLAKIEFRKKPKVTVRLESSVMDFTPLIEMAERGKREFVVAEKRQRLLFPEYPLPFEALSKVDADIAVKARNIQVRDARLEFGRLALSLEDSNLSIDNLEATYKQTKISGNLHIDSGSPPQVATKFLVQHFDLGNLLKEAGVSDQVRAVVDIAAHGRSSGDSVQSLMANLDGSLGAVMGEGYLTRYLDLLSIKLTQKVARFWGQNQEARQINCAVVQFDIEKGIATSQVFVFDTRAFNLFGEGDINLGTEQVNFLLVPKPRHLSLGFATKLRVSGSIMEPKVGPDPHALLSQSARALSAFVIGPIGLLAPFVHLGADQPHPCDIQSLGQLGLQIPDAK